MQEEYIRLSNTDSTSSVNRENFLDVEIQHHTKVFPFPSVSSTIDQREQFEKEREDCTKYRLILTINPYCTNVLFNAVTEIVQNEGTDEPNKLVIADGNGINPSMTYDIQGKENGVTNTDMVRNTEYSNGDNPFEYHCGFDMFNNHILRNQTFKIINPLTDKSYKFKNTSDRNSIKENFNTLRDMMRYSDGSEVKLTRRTDVNTIDGVGSNDSQNDARHLYLKDDILSLIDSINANLYEENGWWGFGNRSSIVSRKFNGGKWDDIKISKVFNGGYFNGSDEQEHMSCEFIEMYPDSTLYSFNPKYNRFQNRKEDNWDICITYPYKTFGLDYDKEEERNKILINGSLGETDGQGREQYVNGLLLASYRQTKGTSGQDILLFRSYVRHNLNPGNKFKLYYSIKNNNGEGNFIEIKDRQFEVVNIGNLNGDFLDYYFYINDINDIKDILGIGNEEKIDETLYNFRFVKVINDRECKYYYRKFRKLPNLRFKKEELTNEIVNDDTLFEQYIDKNCRKTNESEMTPFTKEQYPLAFSRTIYNDANTQIVFTDTIDIDKFTDNLGRPLTELFITIIKRNKGHELWYKRNKTSQDLKDIEFSHCFGKLISGLEIHGEWSDNEYIRRDRGLLGDCSLLTNTSGDLLDDDIVLEHNKTVNNTDKDIFYGDVVELDTYNMRETVLSDVHFRFNTEQREHEFNDEELDCGVFKYDEIVSDDYDLDGFQCEEREIEDTTYRPEGYHYKAHYPIRVREFGSMRQGSHKDIKISSCKPRQANGMFIEVVSTLRSGVSSGDTLYLCNEDETEMIPLTVNSVQSSVRFLVNPMNPKDENYKNIFNIIEGLLYTERTVAKGESWIDEHGNENIAENDTTEKDYGKPQYILRVKNNDIPSYAYKVATNLYLWRDVLNVGNKDTVELTEYPFANGHFYINREINFFLERQDPFNHNWLYAENQIPNDIFGNIRKETNYEYKDERHRVC